MNPDTSSNTEYLTPEEMNKVSKAQQEVARAKEILFVKELELNNALLNVYLDHKLSREDSIDSITGVITRKV